MNRYLIIGLLSCFTGSLTGQSLIDYQLMAAETNPGLQSRYKTFEAAIERIPRMKSLQDPNLSFGYFISPIETRLGPQKARISLTQMFPWFGTLRTAGNVAALNAEAQYQVFLDAKNKLFYQVAAAYYPLYELERWIELEEENVEILTSYKTIATSRFENNEGSLADALRVDIRLKDALVNLEILEKKRQPLKVAFNQLLNRSSDEEIFITDSLELASDLITKDSLFIDNPQLEELDLRIQSSQTQQILAEKQGLPKIGVGLDYIFVRERYDVTLPNNGQNGFMPMVTMSLPIFRGKYQSAKNEARFMQESYQLQKEDRINTLTSEYEMIAFELAQQRDLISLYKIQITETQQVLNLLFSAYGNAGNEFEEILGMQQQLLKYKKMNASAMTNYHVTLAKLNYLTAKKH